MGRPQGQVPCSQLCFFVLHPHYYAIHLKKEKNYFNFWGDTTYFAIFLAFLSNNLLDNYVLYSIDFEKEIQ